MTIASYKMRVDERGALIIPQDAQDVLQLRPGEEVQVSIDRIPTVAPPPNERMLAILRDIQERHKERPYTNPTDTDRLIQEARSGAMYGDECSE